MKVLSIKNAFNTMLKNIEVKEAEKLNKLINKRVRIDGSDMSNEAFNQLETAQRTLANYATAKDIYISFASPKYKPNENSHTISLWIMDKKNKKVTTKILDDDVTKLHKHNVTDYKMYETPDETQVMRKFTKESHEDTFLRNIYRNIETMVNSMRK